MILLKYLRKQLRYTQGELAEVAGVRVGNISAAERQAPPLSDWQLVQLANALGYPGDPGDLLEEYDPEKHGSYEYKIRRTLVSFE